MIQGQNPLISHDVEIFLREVAGDFGLKYPNIRSIYLFGSVARGDADPRSDVDFFFLVQEGTTQEVLHQLLNDPGFWRIFD